jgi:carbonic anhydrase
MTNDGGAHTDVGGPLGALLEGNRRYVSGAAAHPRRSAERRAETARGQNPLAAVLTCADSRVVPEIIFDQGIGDLFVVRVAGNVADDAVIGSIEYAAGHLRVPLVIVLGHTDCGAVNATIAGGEVTGPLARVIGKIAPAVERARSIAGELTENAVRENIALVTGQLVGATPILRRLVDRNEVRIIGAVYDVESGVVTVLDGR